MKTMPNIYTNLFRSPLVPSTLFQLEYRYISLEKNKNGLLNFNIYFKKSRYDYLYNRNFGLEPRR